MAIKTPTSSIARPPKVYPNCDFLYENITIWHHCPPMRALQKNIDDDLAALAKLWHSI
jgi:hypothetical protein